MRDAEGIRAPANVAQWYLPIVLIMHSEYVENTRTCHVYFFRNPVTWEQNVTLFVSQLMLNVNLCKETFSAKYRVRQIYGDIIWF